MRSFGMRDEADGTQADAGRTRTLDLLGRGPTMLTTDWLHQNDKMLQRFVSYAFSSFTLIDFTF